MVGLGIAREVLKHPNPILRKVAKEVEYEMIGNKVNFGGDVVDLMNDLITTMNVELGTGIAAPQIGVELRVLVYMVSKERAEREGSIEIPITGLANPKLFPITEDMEEGWEGCLSVPGNVIILDGTEC